MRFVIQYLIGNSIFFFRFVINYSCPNMSYFADFFITVQIVFIRYIGMIITAEVWRHIIRNVVGLCIVCLRFILVINYPVFVTIRTGRHVIRLVVTEWFNGFYDLFYCFLIAILTLMIAVSLWEFSQVKSASKCPMFEIILQCNKPFADIIKYCKTRGPTLAMLDCLHIHHLWTFSEYIQKILGRGKIHKIPHAS